MENEKNLKLPYNGSLQEAIKKQDREAIKYLMSLNKINNTSLNTSTSSSLLPLPPSSSSLSSSSPPSSNSNTSFNLLNNNLNENKNELNEILITNKLNECLLSIGFSQLQLFEYFIEDINESEALKTLFDSNKHFPIPKKKIINSNSISNSLENNNNNNNNNSNHNTSNNNNNNNNIINDEHCVSSEMLRYLDPESTWTLLQCCVNNPNVSQIQIYELLSQLSSLGAVNLISNTACDWLRNNLICGYITEVQCILSSLYLLLQTDISSSAFPLEKGNSDQLLLSYMCPITREILVEPVTLQVYFILILIYFLK